MNVISETNTYRPVLLPRRGELIAWTLTALATLGLVAFFLRDFPPLWAWIFVVLLYLAALSISLGNWMDRHTLLCLGPDAVTFHNGLRHVHLAWNEVLEVHSLPGRWGRKVHVIGEKMHFSFDTLSEVSFQGQVRGRFGFAQGDEIWGHILHSSGLTVEKLDGQFVRYSRM